MSDELRSAAERTDSEKLETLAKWFDLQQSRGVYDWLGTDVQDDLRRIAQLLADHDDSPITVEALEAIGWELRPFSNPCWVHPVTKFIRWWPSDGRVSFEGIVCLGIDTMGDLKQLVRFVEGA